MGLPLLERVRLPSGLSADLQRVLGSLQNNVEQALARVARREIVPGVLVEGVTLLAGNTFIEHGLNREPKGFLVASPNAAGHVWAPEGVPNNRPRTHMVVTTDTPNITVSLWVF